MLFDFGHDVDLLDADASFGNDSNRVIDLGQAFGELDVDDRPDDLHDLPNLLRCRCLCHNVFFAACGAGSFSACGFDDPA
jgi:hypothetical protein